MTIKDWKKVNSNKLEVLFVMKQYPQVFIQIHKLLQYKPSAARYFVDGVLDEKVFKTKFEALKYAKSYMRTH